MTRTLKSSSLGSIANSYIGDSPQPSTLSYIWNFGSLLALCLVGQIVSGVILAMHYCPNVDLAFTSVEHIMRDVSQGWLVRYLHANIASLFFACVYSHVARGLYYGSYKSPRIAPWSAGVVLLVLMILTAFLGYCLVMGQISLWGATVITSILGALPWLGGDLTELVWGGFSVSNATLNRFYALHFLFPFLLSALAIVHMITLHKHGSGNPLGVDSSGDRLPIAPYFLFKDTVTALALAISAIALVSFSPNLLGHSDNYVEANALVTPSSIVPEWYLLPWYAVLRSVPNKLLGVLAILAGLLILLVLPATDTSRSRGARFNPLIRSGFWSLVSVVFFLLYVGACHVADPWVAIGQLLTTLYFAYFLLLVPITGTASIILLETASHRSSGITAKEELCLDPDLDLNKLPALDPFQLFIGSFEAKGAFDSSTVSLTLTRDRYKYLEGITAGLGGNIEVIKNKATWCLSSENDIRLLLARIATVAYFPNARDQIRSAAHTLGIGDLQLKWSSAVEWERVGPWGPNGRQRPLTLKQGYLHGWVAATALVSIKSWDLWRPRAAVLIHEDYFQDNKNLFELIQRTVNLNDGSYNPKYFDNHPPEQLKKVNPSPYHYFYARPGHFNSYKPVALVFFLAQLRECVPLPDRMEVIYQLFVLRSSRLLTQHPWSGFYSGHKDEKEFVVFEGAYGFKGLSATTYKTKVCKPALSPEEARTLEVLQAKWKGKNP